MHPLHLVNTFCHYFLLPLRTARTVRLTYMKLLFYVPDSTA